MNTNGNGFPFPGYPAGAPGNAGNNANGAQAAGGGTNANTGGAPTQPNNNNYAGGFNPMWTPPQIEAWVAQQQAAYAANAGGNAPPAGGNYGATNGMFGAGFSVGGNMFGGATGGGVNAPPGVNQMYGTGLGFQGMGMGAANPMAFGGIGVGGVGGGIGGFGLPPYNGMPPQMPPMPPPMGGTFPGQHQAARTNALPIPSANCGALGLRCHQIGPNDPTSVRDDCMEPVNAIVDQNQTFVRAEYLERVGEALRPVVYITLAHQSMQVFTMFGFKKYHSMNRVPSLSDGKYKAFLGNGDQQPHQALFTLPQSTVDAMATWESSWVCTEAMLDQFYAGNDAPDRLVPPVTANDPNVQEVVYWRIMPCPNGLVHLFSDAPHPYVALQRLRYLANAFPPQDRDCLIMLRYFLRAACHARPAPEAGSLVSRSFESTMLTGGMGGDSELNDWALHFHNMLIPPPPVLPTPPIQSQSMSAAEVKLMMLEEFKSRGSGESTSRGCRKMKDDEYKLMLSIGGYPLDTPRDSAPPFIKLWEDTAGNENAMRKLSARVLHDSAQTLKMTQRVHFIRPPFAKALQHLQFSLGYDNSYPRSHLGMNIAVVHYMRGTMDEAAKLENLSMLHAMATNITPEQEEQRQGKPGYGPLSVMELVFTIEEYIIFLHAHFGSLNGAHSRAVVLIMRVLKRIYIGESVPLSQMQLDDIFWTIFLDGRSSFKSAESAQYTTLNRLVNELEDRALVPRAGTPHTRLSPQAKVTFKRQVEEAWEARGGDDQSVASNAEGSPSQKKRKSGFGSVSHYHPKIRLKWATIVETMAPATVPKLKELVTKVKTKENHAYSLKTFSKLLGENACAVGHVTGVCTNPTCTRKHDGKVSDEDAATVCKVLEEAMKDP